MKESGRPVQDTVASGAPVGRLQHGGWKFRLGHAWALQQLAGMEVSPVSTFPVRMSHQLQMRCQVPAHLSATSCNQCLPCRSQPASIPNFCQLWLQHFFSQSDINIPDPKLAHCKGSLFSVIWLSFPHSPSTLGHAGCVCESAWRVDAHRTLTRMFSSSTPNTAH